MARLKTAVDSSKEELRPLLSQRKECLAAYQGHRFSSEHLPRVVDAKMSVPLMEIAIDLHEQLLAGETVRSLVTPRRAENVPLGESIKSSLDHLAEAVNLSQSFQNWVKESLWGWGVGKVGLSFKRGSAAGKGGGFGRSGSIPFFDVIDAEDAIIDTQAASWSRMRYIGNRYLVPLDWAKDTPSFNAKARKELQAVDPESNRPFGNSSPIRWRTDTNALFPMTELVDLYMPLDNQIVTFSHNGPRDVLHHETWRGPSVGPYHLLGYEFVKGTVIPKPLAWSWIDTHDSVNVMYNKAVRQALRSKRNPVVPAGAEKDAERLKNAQDGEWVGATRTEQIRTFVIPGADPSLLNLVGQLIDLFSYMAGNMNLLAGLSAQSPTLGQDQILRGSGSRRMAELQRRSRKAFSGVMSSLAWYLFNQRDLRVLTERKIGDITVKTVLKHEDLKGRFLEFNFETEVIRHKSPDERLALLLNWISQVVLPLQTQMAQAGKTLDFDALHRMGRDVGDIPELDLIIKDLGRQPSPEEVALLSGGRAGGTSGSAPRRSEASPQGPGQRMLAAAGADAAQEGGFVG